MNKHAGLATFAKTLIRDPRLLGKVKGVLSGGAKGAVKKIKAIPGGVKETAKDWMFSPRGMFGENIKRIGKNFARSPIKTMRSGWRAMEPSTVPEKLWGLKIPKAIAGRKVPVEKGLMGLLGYGSAMDAMGELRPGETRGGRIGSNLGLMAGYLATPVSRVGMLGNILAGDIIGGTVGRTAGRVASKVVGAKPKPKPIPGSFEEKFKS